MIFPSIQNSHPKIIIQKQPETKDIPCFRLLFYSCWILSCPALIRLYSGLTMGLTPSLFLDIIPDYTIQIKTQDTKH